MQANSLAGCIRLVSASLARPSTQEALDALVKTPGWELKVKEWFRKDKKAGLGRGLAIPFSVAILTLFQAWGADTADQFISKAKQESSVGQKEKFSQGEVGRMENAIPYPLNKTQIKALLTGKIKVLWMDVEVELTSEEFYKSLNKEIKKGLDGKVLPAVRKDPKFSTLPKDGLRDLIVKATIQKMNNPAYAEGKNALAEYLKREKKDMEYVYDLIRKSVGENLS